MAAAAATRAVRETADKQFETMLKTVEPLKSVEFSVFWRQVTTASNRNSWHDSILDQSKAVLVVADPDAPTDPELKYQLDQKNCYHILIDRTMHHPTGHLLTTCTLGDGREAAKMVFEFFHRKTTAGLDLATNNFFGSTMANTDTNVVQWISEVRARADILKQAGGTIDDKSMVVRLLGGLLPEFREIRVILQRTSGLTFTSAVSELMDFAHGEKLTEVTLTGHKKIKGNSYSVEGEGSTFRSRQDGGACRNWTRYACKYGSECRYSHKGPGGSVSVEEQAKFKKWLQRRRDTQIGPRKETRLDPVPANTPRTDAKTHLVDVRSEPDDEMDARLISNVFFGSDEAQPAPSTIFPYTFARASEMLTQRAKVDAPKVDIHDLDAPKDPIQTSNGRGKLETNPGSTTRYLLMGMMFVSIFLPCYWRVGATLFLASVSVTEQASWSYILHHARYAIEFVRLHFFPIGCGFTFFVWACFFIISDVPRVDAQSFLVSTPSARSDYWCCDSGTNRFVTNNISDFAEGTVVHKPTKVAVGGGNITSPAYGTVLVRSLDHNRVVQCTNVLLMPACAKKLMPTSPFVKHGCKLVIENVSGTERAVLYDKRGNHIFDGFNSGGLYYFRCDTVQPGECTTNMEANTSYFGLPLKASKLASNIDFPRRLLEAHWSLGHLNFSKVRKMFGLKPGDNPACDACASAISRTEPIGSKPARATRVNERMHMDVGFTRNNNFTFHLKIDDFSRKGYLSVIDSKSEVLPDWIQTKTHLEKRHAPWKFSIVRTDGEPIYTTPAWELHCKEEGIVHEVSSRYRHDQNGVVERAMQAIGTAFRCMMIQGNAPDSDSPHALRMSSVVRNNSPSKSNGGRTPNEKEVGVKIPVNPRLMKGPLFCLAYAHVYADEGRLKHAERGIPCVYLGFDETNNNFILKEWSTGRIFSQADITCYPHIFPYRSNPIRIAGSGQQFTDIAPILTVEPPAAVDPLDVHLDDHSSAPVSSSTTRPTRIREPSRRMVEIISDKSDRGEPLNKPQQRAADQLTLSRLANTSQAYDLFAFHVFGPDPTTWEECITSKYADEWIAADLLEQQVFKHYDVLEFVPRSTAAGRRVYQSKPVYKIKVHPPTPEEPTGSIDKFKVRMTIAAYTRSMQQGIDFEEKRASMVRWNGVLILIATAVQFDLDITLFDLEAFFLNGVLNDDVFMEQPRQWPVEGKPAADWIYKLRKSMYGLPQASHCANRKLKQTLTSDGKFNVSSADDCVFISTSDSSYAAIGAHSDDLLTVGDTHGTSIVRDLLSSVFTIKETRNPTLITGVQVDRNRTDRTLKLHQTAFIQDLLIEHGMENSASADTPVDPGMAKTLMLLPTTPVDMDANKKYQQLVGSLLWLQQRTRFDLSFCVNLLCRWLRVATRAHYDLARGRPLRYLRGTVHFGLMFAATDGEWKLSGVSDADFAGDIIGSRSTGGFYTKLGDVGTVNCTSALDRKIATSSQQAETYAMASLVKDLVWTRHLLSDLKHPMTGPTPTATDNHGVKQQSSKAVNHSKAKHFRVAQAYIRSKFDDRTIEVVEIDSKDNAADLLTKPLAAEPFARHVLTILGPQDRIASLGEGK